MNLFHDGMIEKIVHRHEMTAYKSSFMKSYLGGGTEGAGSGIYDPQRNYELRFPEEKILNLIFEISLVFENVYKIWRNVGSFFIYILF